MDNAPNDGETLDQRAARYIADLHSRNKHVRERAFDMLKEIGPDPILSQLLVAHDWASQNCNTTWRVRSVVLSLMIGLAGFLVYSAIATCLTNIGWSIGAFLFGGLCAVLAGLFLLVVKPSSGSEFSQQSLLRLLCSSEDPQTAGALCDYLRSPALRKRDPGIAEGVRRALARLLPRVRGDTTDNLNSRQRAVLRLELRYLATGNYSHHPEFAIAIMKCMETVGDVAAIREVERLYAWNEGPRGSRDLREQAQHCVSVLRALQEAEKQGKALLRSSESPGASAELLRQAKSPEAHSEELVRPADGDEEPGSKPGST